MLDLLKGARLIAETCMAIKPDEEVLIISDDYARSVRIAELVTAVAKSLRASAVMIVTAPAGIAGTEPARTIAAAMKTADAILLIGSITPAHTDARQEATDAGVRIYNLVTTSEDDLKADISPEDIYLIKERTEKVADMLTRASKAEITSVAGTNLVMSLAGRKGLALHPMGGDMGFVPDYAEATIAPVEGSSEGELVIDVAMIGWGHLLREPLHLKVKGGKVVEISGYADESERLRKIASTDVNASNIAEFAIGTSHVIPRVLRGMRRDVGISGMVHIAIGRSNDIGGATFSKIHIDGILSRATVDLDGVRLVDKEVLKI